MIGVLCKDGEKNIVREFFELFKTPWEPFSVGRSYEVVISTRGDPPALAARLLVLYSSNTTPFDARSGLTLATAGSGLFADGTDTGIPIYGTLASVFGAGEPLPSALSDGRACAVRVTEPQGQTVRVGYDLFWEVAFLLVTGQPPVNALIPTLDLHIALLREWIVGAGIPLAEIPPQPWGHTFMACLTHDVDFGGIRLHRFGHTLWGFVYRALVGSVVDCMKGTGSLGRLARNWIAVLTLPLVYMGIMRDPWDDFARYCEIEDGLASTFFLIPFRGRTGTHVPGKFPGRRATPYDIDDMREQIAYLRKHGCEIGLHGIDAWTSVEAGRAERQRIVAATGDRDIGVRIHWLCYDRQSLTRLDQAGFDYDSTLGYNETIGYKAGTVQVFQPCDVTRLLELPLHIQDTALFYPHRMALTDAEARALCDGILRAASQLGGVVTVLWHQRSLAPERLWDTFYVRLVQGLRDRGAWFGTARQVVEWFRQRRSVRFGECRCDGKSMRLWLTDVPSRSNGRLFVRVHRQPRSGSSRRRETGDYVDVPLAGTGCVEIPLGATGAD